DGSAAGRRAHGSRGAAGAGAGSGDARGEGAGGMKRGDLDRVASSLAEPMTEFVRESRVRTAILINHAGQVLASHGFSRGFDAANVAALSAAAHASAHALAELTGAGHWMHMHHAGKQNQL